MRIAVIGCSHGTLDDIYASVDKADSEGQARGEPPVELVICCGDFQAMRSLPDLESMACPVKYRALGQFHNYYAQRKRAPYLTIVIGGNHESSGYMWETFHGGWLAPSIYFLGFAGCVLVDGWLRIAGASGIYKSNDFRKGHFETVPYDDRTIRSVYHIREYEVMRLLALQGRGPNPDIFLSHDWPLGIEQHGDVAALIREKPFFKDEIRSNTLGSPPLDHLLKVLQPGYWFSAHLHVKFAALVHHDGRPTTVKGRGPPPRQQQAAAAAVEAAPNPDEIALEDDEDDEEPPTPVAEMQESAANPNEIVIADETEEDEAEGLFSEEKKGAGCECAGEGAHGHVQEKPMETEAVRARLGLTVPLAEADTSAEAGPGPRTTKFLALSKPGHGKDFLQVVDIPSRPGIPRPAAQPTAVTGDDAPRSRTEPVLYFDPHWLAVLRALHPSLSTSNQAIPLPPASQAAQLIDQSYAWVKENVGQDGLIPVEEVQKFVRTAPASGEGADHSPRQHSSAVWYTNPQTEALCELLGLENKINPVPAGFKEAQAAAEAEKAAALAEAKRAALAQMEVEPVANEDEIAIEDDDEDE